MSWGEAIRLTGELASDPSTRVAAALNSWQHTITRETMAVLDLFDLTHTLAWAQGGKKGAQPKPHTRPWDKPTSSGVIHRRGNTEGRSEAEVRAILRKNAGR